MSPLADLQLWYDAQCDDDWEHQHGVKIETLDNPGWAVTIDLAGTLLEDHPFAAVRRGDPHDDDDAWIDCKVEGNRFVGHGGTRQLETILQTFLDWAKAKPKSNRMRPRGSTKRAAPARRSSRRRPLELEDCIVELAESGKLAEAAAGAIRAAKAAGLPVTFLEGNDVIREYPDGRREILETLEPAPVIPIPKGVKRIRNGNARRM